MDYYSQFQYILPTERYFAGTFIGDIKSFKFYNCRLEYSDIKENYLYEMGEINEEKTNKVKKELCEQIISYIGKESKTCKRLREEYATKSDLIALYAKVKAMVDENKEELSKRQDKLENMINKEIDERQKEIQRLEDKINTANIEIVGDDNSIVVSPADSKPQGVWRIDENSKLLSNEKITVKSGIFSQIDVLLGDSESNMSTTPVLSKSMTTNSSSIYSVSDLNYTNDMLFLKFSVYHTAGKTFYIDNIVLNLTSLYLLIFSIIDICL